MVPVLFRVFGVAIPSYAVLMVAGYLVALYALFKIAPKGEPKEPGDLSRSQVWDLYIVMVVSSVIGSKFGHVLFEAAGHRTEDGRVLNSLAELLAYDPLHWARLGEPGYVWYGGLIGGLSTAVFYFYRRPHLRAWLYADAFAPAIMFGAGIGRIGCFLAGCCHGEPTDSFVGIDFPNTPGPVHPTQLYDSVIGLTLGTILFWRFPRRSFEGENIAILLVAYSLMRSITEVFRGDAERGGLGPLSTSQWISVPLFVTGILLWVRLSRRSPSPATP